MSSDTLVVGVRLGGAEESRPLFACCAFVVVLDERRVVNHMVLTQTRSSETLLLHLLHLPLAWCCWPLWGVGRRRLLDSRMAGHSLQ